MRCFSPRRLNSFPVPVPCSKCEACRINKRREWKTRLQLEAMCHTEKSFLTLTYADPHLPCQIESQDGGFEFYNPKTGEAISKASLDFSHHRDFMKRFRERVRDQFGEVRFFAVGEYGDKFGRPHFHYAMFGFPRCKNFERLEALYKATGRRDVCHCDLCVLLANAWGKGRIQNAPLEAGSMNYICGYVVKKMTSNKLDIQKKYLEGREPEYIRLSLDGGIGTGGSDAPMVARIAAEFEKLHVSPYEFPGTVQIDGVACPLGRYMRLKVFNYMFPSMDWSCDDLKKSREEKAREVFYLQLLKEDGQTPPEGTSLQTLHKMMIASGIEFEMKAIHNQRRENFRAKQKLQQSKRLSAL